MSSAEARQQLEDLVAIKRSGTLESIVDGETIKFQSRADLNRSIRELETKLGIRKRDTGTKSVFMGHR